MTPGAFLIAKVLAILALVGAVLFGVHTYNESLRHEGYAKAEKEYKPRAERAERALEFSEKERARYEHETKALGQVAADARDQRDRAEAAYAGLVRSGQLLRDQLAAIRRAQAVGAPATAAGGQAADASLDLYTDVQRRLDEATDGIALFADRSRIAGLACQRSQEVTSP